MKELRWGIIGCGDVARKRVVQAIRDDPRSQLVAACRRNETMLRDFCETFEVRHAYADAQALINDHTVDAVYIATPVREHLPQTLAAAEAGKHVLVEKPMARSVAECDEMIRACRAAGVKLGVAYYRRFYPLVHRVEELMQNGEIGKPLSVSAITATPLALQPGQDGYWRVLVDEGGGGALMDIGSHRINVFLHLCGPIVEVKAHCCTIAADYDAEDTALLLVRCQSGLVGTLQCHFGSTIDPDELAVQGTHGRLVARPLNGSELIVETKDQRRTEQLPPAANLCGPLVADFAAAVLENREPTVTGEEGRATNRVMESAYADSSVGGTTVMRV